MDSTNEEIVISGIGGFFPGCKNTAEWRQKLFGNQIELVEKWSKNGDLCNVFGSVPTDRFDNSYFGIHKLQILYMNPMHRLSMERTFEALIDAGINPNSLSGKKIGCYVGISTDENSSLFLESAVGGFGLTGNARAMISNRISYWLNLKGPSVTYDSNWVSGFEVIRLAFDAIRKGECEGAIVGAANLIFFPEFHEMYEELELTSTDGKTRSFTADANGYGRSDGVVMCYIQKASDANRCYGTIVSVDTQFYGNTEDKISKIDNKRMKEFLKEFYSNSPVKPEQIDYLETYGCGLKDIDKAELDAIEEVYCKNRSKPLLIGSVKTQSGHAETSSTLFSLVKVILAMEEEVIPATLNVGKLNPEIEGLHNGHFEVVTTNRKWNSDYAAINGIGLNNYFAHMIFKRNPKKKVGAVKCEIPRILPVSTRTEETVQEVLATLQNKPEDPEFDRLVYEVFSRHVPQHTFRGYLLKSEKPKKEFSFMDDKRRAIWFVFSGMGSQWMGMLSDLMKFPVVAQSITNSHNILMTRGVDLMHILTAVDKTVFDNVLNCFVGISAMQIAITDLLHALGIVPDGIIGHSLGELGCAYADGCMTAEQMLLSAYSRGRAILDTTLMKGLMAAVGLGYNQIKDQLPESIEVACHNGPESCTISGPVEDMEKYIKELHDKGVFARLVNAADIAYHSRYIQPAAPLLHKYLKEVLPEPSLRSSKWVSTSNQVENWNTELSKYSSSDYHTNNLLSPVFFEEGCKYIPKASILIEIAPHGLMQAILKRSMKDSISVPLTNRSAKSGVDFLLQSLGKLFLLGMDLNFAELYPSINFPVSRNTPTLSDLAGWNYTENWKQTPQCTFDNAVTDTIINLNSEKFEKYLGNKIKGNVVIPVGLYLNLLYECLDPKAETYLFENLHFRKHPVLLNNSEMTVHQVFHPCSGEFEFWSNKELVLSGRVIQPDGSNVFEEEVVVAPNEDFLEMNETEIYEELKHRGYDYPSSFWKLRKLKLSNEGSVATIDSGDQWTELIDGIIQHQSVISGEKYQNILLPQKISQIWINIKKMKSDKKEVQVNYDYVIKTLSTDGIVIRDIEMSEWNVGETDLVLEYVEYIPLEKVSFKDIEAALEFSIQLTRGNFITPCVQTILVTELISQKNSFYEILKKISNELIHLNVSVSTANSVEEIYIQQLYPQLIVLGDEPTKDLLEKIASSDVVLFSKITNFVLSYPGLIEMSRIIVNGEEYSVFRKASSMDVTIVDIENVKPNIADLEGGKAKWVSKLLKAVKSPTKQNKQVYLVCTSMPVEGFEYFIREIRQQPDMQNVRFLFNLDKYNGDLASVFRKNLIISILKNGKLSTIIHQSIKYKSDEHSKTFSKKSNQNIQYISLNLEDETINPSIKDNTVGNLDYSGIDSDGKRIMGLARIDEGNSEIKADPIFKWELPEKWSISDGATVPHAFLSAYYMMVIKGKLQSGTNVLIHAGCSPIGMTAIGIALAYRCNVYTTVFNKQQKAFILDKYTCISPSSIYLLDGASFKANFMNSTSGQGARLVLNCLTGNYVRESMDCCGQYCSFFHYGKYDLYSGNRIGMARFMLNVSFYVVDLNNLVNLDTETKKQLWELVVFNFDNYFILPLTWTVRCQQDIPDILSNFRTGLATSKVIFRTSDMNSLISNKFTCSPNFSYIVFGGNSEIWMNVVGWLIHRGAKKVIVSGDTSDNQENLNRRLALYKKYFDAQIYISRQKATIEGVSQLIQESSNLGLIDAVILLSNESGALNKEEHMVVENLIGALNKISPEASLINYIPTVAGICHNRSNAGFKTYTVELTRDSDIRVGLNALNQIVLKGSGHTILQENIESHESIIEVGKFLPTLIQIIEHQKQSLVEPDIVQIFTEGPTKYREVAPIFIIQGLAGNEEVKKMAQALLYPTYCTVMPCTPWPIEKLAEIYAEKIEKIYPRNVYNLVSLSTSGALMLEIATKLQERRKNVQIHLFFIDSAPKIAQEAIVQLGEQTDYELNILRTILNINDIKVLDIMRSLEHWEDRVKYCTKTYKQREEVLVQRGLMSVKHILDDLKRYRPRGFAVTGEVHLLRPSIMDQFKDCGLKEYCQRQPLVKLVDGDHLSIICHPDTIEYINFHVDV